MNVRSILYPFKLFREVLLIKPDIVHSEFGPYGYEWGGYIGEYFLIFLFLLKIFRIPNTLTFQNLYMRRQVELRAALRINNRLYNKLASIIYIGFTKLLIFFCDLIQVLSNKMNSRVREVYIQDFKLPAHKIVDLPNSCDNFFSFERVKIINGKQDVAKTKLNLNKKFVLLCFGWIYSVKGIEYVIKSLKYIKNRENIILIIAGETHPTEGIRYVNYIKKLIIKTINENPNFNIKFMNHYLSVEDVNTLFNSADIILLTYIENYGASGVLHLAASYGKPVISFNIGYHWKDAIDHTVILCPYKNINCLAKKIDYYYENPEKLRILKEKILNYANRETWDKACERTINYYKIILKNRKKI